MISGFRRVVNEIFGRLRC